MECAGFNSQRTQGPATLLVKKRSLDVIGILETKIEELADLHQIFVTKFGVWRALHNFDLIDGGRIVLCWKPQTVDVQVI